jgi:hypothetical protein
MAEGLEKLSETLSYSSKAKCIATRFSKLDLSFTQSEVFHRLMSLDFSLSRAVFGVKKIIKARPILR